MAGYDSPSAAMALGAGVGLADLGIDGMGISDGGMGGSVLGETSATRMEDEKKRKLQAVIDILKVGGSMIYNSKEHGNKDPVGSKGTYRYRLHWTSSKTTWLGNRQEQKATYDCWLGGRSRCRP